MHKIFGKLGVLMLFGTILFSGCYEPEEVDYVPDFQNQEAQGKMNGEDFVMQSASAVVSNGNYEVFLWTDAHANLCDVQEEGRYISFLIPRTEGLNDLALSGGLTHVQCFDRTMSDFPVVTVLHGVIEIISIDIEESVSVTGRLDIHEDDGNHINGNFTATHCN